MIRENSIRHDFCRERSGHGGAEGLVDPTISRVGGPSRRATPFWGVGEAHVSRSRIARSMLSNGDLRRQAIIVLNAAEDRKGDRASWALCGPMMSGLMT